MEKKSIYISRVEGEKEMWCLFSDEDSIETYEKLKTINFKELIDYLIKDDFKNSFELVSKIDTPEEYENNLIEIIREILRNYNQEKVSYDEYVARTKVE